MTDLYICSNNRFTAFVRRNKDNWEYVVIDRNNGTKITVSGFKSKSKAIDAANFYMKK